MNNGTGPGLARHVLAPVVRIRGSVPLPPGCDGPQLLLQVLADLHRRGCSALLGDDGTIMVQGGSESRGSVLAFVDGGWIKPGRHSTVRTLDYTFSTRGGLQLCAGLSVVAAGLAWFTLDSLGLAAFGALAPLLWLYGANFVITTIRVPAWLTGLSMSAPKMKPDGHR